MVAMDWASETFETSTVGVISHHCVPISERANAQSRAFLYLTTSAAIMIIINITQAFLIAHLHSLAWILGFPLAVFTLLLAMIAWRTAMSYRDARTAWHAASGAERAAWTGAVLSILLPIVVCQFIYMPLVARPAWHKIVWTTSLRVAENAQLPSIAFIQYGIFHVHIKDIGYNIWDRDSRNGSCVYSAHPFHESLPEYLDYFTLQCLGPDFNTDKHPNKSAIDELYLGLDFHYVCTSSAVPKLRRV